MTQSHASRVQLSIPDSGNQVVVLTGRTYCIHSFNKYLVSTSHAPIVELVSC